MNNFSIGTPVNLAPTGIASFAKCPICLDLHHTGADIAVLGAPFDLAIQGRTGTRLGPRGIRAASTRFSYKPGGRVYLTFDIDGMDAACAPATGSPMFGGFLYDEVVEMFEAIAKHSQVIGMDMVEVAPPYDDAGDTTAYLAARLVSDLLGFVTKERERAEQ